MPLSSRWLSLVTARVGCSPKLTATETGDKLWRTVSDKPLDDADYTPAQKEQIRSFLFLDPLPCVRRTVFVSTPHRGSYRIGGFLQKITRRLVSIPATLS